VPERVNDRSFEKVDDPLFVMDTSRESDKVSDGVSDADDDTTDEIDPYETEFDDVPVGVPVSVPRLRDDEGNEREAVTDDDVDGSRDDVVEGDVVMLADDDDDSPDAVTSADTECVRVPLRLNVVELERVLVGSAVDDAVSLMLGRLGDAEVDSVLVWVFSFVEETESVAVGVLVRDDSMEDDPVRLRGRVKLFSRDLVIVPSSETVVV
jgi:hypothetical protein